MSEQERPTPPALKPLALLDDLDDLEVPVGAACDPNDPDCAAPAAPAADEPSEDGGASTSSG